MAQKIDLKKITAIDLFAGAGGFSLAAHNQGLDILAAVELDPDACKTYTNNIINKRSSRTKLYEGDIQQIDPKKIMTDTKIKSGQLDLLMGGPPCQGFSSHRLNGKGIDDPRNNLLLRYFDFVKEFMPKIFLIENVPGILWPRHKNYLDNFKRLANSAGYSVFSPVRLNAKDFGVPQNRIRVFILGIQRDYSSCGIIWPPEPTHFKPGVGYPEWKNASEVFEKPDDKFISKLKSVLGENVVRNLTFSPNAMKASDPSLIHMNHTAPMKQRIENTPINGSRRDSGYVLECHKNHNGHKDVYGRIKLAQPGPTMTTGCYNPSKGRFLHPWENHGITARHAARFQSFPDDYVFSGGITSQGKQIGNAVPVNLGEKLIQTIADEIRKMSGKNYYE